MYLSPTKVRILAHRGSTEGGAVENTLEAFRFAVDAGLSYLETDVQATSDGVAVLFHDSTQLRIAGVKQAVKDLTLAELRELQLPNGSRIPTLQEVLERFPDSKFNIDIKTKDAVKPAAKVIAENSAQDRVLVSSFSRKRRLAILQELGNVATSSDGFTLFVIWLTFVLGLRRFFEIELAALSALQIPTKFGPIRFTRKFVQAVQALGVEVHFWTINSIDEADLLVKTYGAKGIVTDKGKMMKEHFA